MTRTEALVARDFAALTGGCVTEGHARHCREHGHATHIVNGVMQPHCPRCGDERVTPDSVEKFERALDLEHEVRSADAARAFAPTAVERGRAHESHRAAQVRLFAALDALTPAELVAFGPYRVKARA